MAHKGNNNKEIEEDERTFRRLKREQIKANENVAEEFDSSSGRINICSEFLKLKSLINEKKDDLMNIDSDRFYSILHEFNKLHEQVMRPREHVVDAEALLDLTHTLAESVKSQVNEGVTPSQFVSSLLKHYAHPPNTSIDWNNLGIAVSPIFLTAHGSSTMLGTMENKLKQHKMYVSRKRAPLTTTTSRPEQLDDVVGGEKTDTDKNMLTMFNILREKKKVQLEHLILNRFSFGQTVENLFALSFLVKDGRAEIIMDKNHSHYVSPKNAPTANSVMSKEVSYTHFVFRYDFNDWKIMKDIVAEGDELMPQRIQYNNVEEVIVEESPECNDENASSATAIRRCRRKLP
ncbi:hypothetical protein P8452_32425 [Trifolium repens]|nr:hypothetical protein P8452_32425 [Trifolium repens]